MLWKKKNPNRNEQLDRVGRQLLQSSQASEETIETAVSSPALFERICAGASDRANSPSGTINNRAINNRAVNHWAADTWAAPLAIAWRAVPALTLVTIVALVLWLGAKGSPPESSFDNGVDIINSESAARATACSVATKEECAVSTDDAVAILVSATAKETNR